MRAALGFAVLLLAGCASSAMHSPPPGGGVPLRNAAGERLYCPSRETSGTYQALNAMSGPVGWMRNSSRADDHAACVTRLRAQGYDLVPGAPVEF